jgi:predicted nucleic acid-binding protein
MDASVIGPLAVPDEVGTLSPHVVATLLGTPFVVPMHWHLEVVSMIHSAQRRQRITPKFASRLLAGELSLDPFVDDLTAAQAWRVTAPLALKHGLTIYDAAYLELSLRRAAPLASLDKALIAAARAEGAALVDLA